MRRDLLKKSQNRKHRSKTWIKLLKNPYSECSCQTEPIFYRLPTVYDGGKNVIPSYSTVRAFWYCSLGDAFSHYVFCVEDVKTQITEIVLNHIQLQDVENRRSEWEKRPYWIQFIPTNRNQRKLWQQRHLDNFINERTERQVRKSTEHNMVQL